MAKTIRTRMSEAYWCDPEAGNMFKPAKISSVAMELESYSYWRRSLPIFWS